MGTLNYFAHGWKRAVFVLGNPCRLSATISLAFIAIAPSGCGVLPNPLSNDDERPKLNLTTLGVGDTSTHFEGSENDLFDLAEYVPLDVDTPRVIRGFIDGASDVDVYDLGPGLPGDRIIVDLTAQAGLAGAIGLFDENGVSLLINDHRNVYLGTLTPFIDVVLQHPTSACYVAVANTPGFSDSGDYALLSSKSYPSAPLPLNPDTIILIFDGAENVRIGGRAPIDILYFDPATIDEDYEGTFESMAEVILREVREDYEGIDITILSTSEGDLYEPGMTRIFFGHYDAALLGVAEGVDEFNALANQRAIVFTDTFRAFNRLNPTVEQLGRAIANVASHEIGHLMGLVHTRDSAGIMDVTASLKALMQDQAFRRSPIYEGVFPVGEQDGLRYMYDAMGGDETIINRKTSASRQRVPAKLIVDDAPAARLQWRLSGCCLQESKLQQ